MVEVGIRCVCGRSSVTTTQGRQVVPTQTQLDQRIATANRDTIGRLKASAAEAEQRAKDFDALAKYLDGHGSEAGEELAGHANERAKEERQHATAEARRADHLVRFG